jgi:hypothetical protein
MFSKGEDGIQCSKMYGSGNDFIKNLYMIMEFYFDIVGFKEQMKNVISTL